MGIKANSLLEEAWNLEDEFTALAGSALGRTAKAVRGTPKTADTSTRFPGLPEWRQPWFSPLKNYSVFWSLVSDFFRLWEHSSERVAGLTPDFFASLEEFVDSAKLEKDQRLRPLLFKALNRFFLKRTGTPIDPYLTSEQLKHLRIPRGGSFGVVKHQFGFKGVHSTYHVFNLLWTRVMLNVVKDRLREEFQKQGETELLDPLWQACVEPDTKTPSSKLLGMPDKPFMRRFKFKRRYDELLRSAVSQTVADPHAVDAEVAHLESTLHGRAEILGLLPGKLTFTKASRPQTRKRRLSRLRKTSRRRKRTGRLKKKHSAGAGTK